jgi:hypothetical protein
MLRLGRGVGAAGVSGAGGAQRLRASVPVCVKLGRVRGDVTPLGADDGDRLTQHADSVDTRH